MVIMLIFPFIIPINGASVRACMCICVRLLPIYEIICVELDRAREAPKSILKRR